MKRLTDVERLVAVNRLIRRLKPILSEMEEIASNAGDISPEKKEEILNMMVEDFFGPKSLATKRYIVLKALKYREINTVRDLTQASKDELLKREHIGTKTLELIEDVLASYGLSIEKP